MESSCLRACCHTSGHAPACRDREVMMSLPVQHRKGIVALEIGVAVVGTTAAIMKRRSAAHRNDIDVESCIANLHRVDAAGGADRR